MHTSKTPDASRTRNREHATRASFARGRLTLALLLLVACLCAPHALAQSQRANASARKLPSPEKIVGEYLKVVGGKKRVAAVRDSVYEWDVRVGDAEAGRARTQTKSPASARADLSLKGGETNAASNGRSAWERGPEGQPRTLTDGEARAAKLQASLEAGRLADYKKQNVLARTVALEQAGGEQAYVVEFATREGARLRYWFGASSKLLLMISDDAQQRRVRLSDYRNAEGLLVPHRMEIERRDAEPLTLTLKSARHNAGLADVVFDPPADDALNVAALLRELTRNQAEVDKRINDYTFTRKDTERKVNDRGEVTKETVKVYEVYPIQGWGRVLKLVSENGVPLSAERAAKEERRVAEELERAEREAPGRLRRWEHKRAEAAAKRKAEREAARKKAGGAAGVDEEDSDDDDLSIGAFLRACEFVSPRRERFRERDVIVFDFRARHGFKPANKTEAIIAKLVGVAWIDPAERHVVRLEARFAEGHKIAGGLVASLRSGSAFVFEQTRLPDGVWLPRFSQLNASIKLFLVAGVTINETREYGDYKRFTTKTGDATLDAPKPEKP